MTTTVRLAGTRRGPRSESGEARSAILAAARHLFLASEFSAVSLRQIAREAGVDTSLIGYYFGTKQDLYNEAMALPSGPHLIIQRVCAQCGPDDLGESLLKAFVQAWDGHVGEFTERGSATLQGVIEAMITRPNAFELVRSFFQDLLIEPIAAILEERFEPEEAHLRADIGLSRLLGLFSTRYVLGLDAMAGVDGQELVAREAASLQQVLTGDIPGSRA